MSSESKTGANTVFSDREYPVEEIIKGYEYKFPKGTCRFSQKEVNFFERQASQIVNGAFAKCADPQKISREAFVFVCALTASALKTKGSEKHEIEKLISCVRNVIPESDYDKWLKNRINEYLYLIFEVSSIKYLGQSLYHVNGTEKYVDQSRLDASGRCILFFIDCIYLYLLGEDNVALLDLKHLQIAGIFDVLNNLPIIIGLLRESEAVKNTVFKHTKIAKTANNAKSTKDTKKQVIKRSEASKKFIGINLIVAALLFIAIAKLPYAYYGILRIAVPALLLTSWYELIEIGRKDLFARITCIAICVIAIIFNPIFPIYLNKEIWVIIDGACGGVLVLLSAIEFCKTM